MRFHLLIGLLLIHPLASYANPDCFKKALQGLVKSHETPEIQLGAFNEREKLTVKVSKKVKPLIQDTEKAIKIGRDLQEAERAYLMLKAVTPQTKEIAGKLHEVELLWSALNRDLIDLNNGYIKSLHALYKEEGIPSIIVKTTDNSEAWRFFPSKDREVAGRELLSLKLNLKTPPQTNRGHNYYQRVQKVFGLEEVTVSLHNTASTSFAGFFSPATARLEIGPEGAKGLLQQYINSIGKHEARHAMFNNKRATGTESIFHTQFFASQDGHLLNQVQFYERFMSAEELYTYSTDLQSLAQIFKGDFLTDQAKKAGLLAQISDKSEGLIQVSKTQVEVTQKMINGLNQTLAKADVSSGIKLDIHPNGNYTMSFSDELGRSAQATFVSEAEKELLKKYQLAHQNLKDAANAYLEKEVKAKGIDVADLSKRIALKQVTAEEVSSLIEIGNRFIKLPEAQTFKAPMDEALRSMVTEAKTRMEKLNKLASIQRAEAARLQITMKQAPDPSPEKIEEFKKKMFNIAKNVKEQYKGFALNPK